MSYTINDREIDLVDSNWKYLALLDASRYDYFKEVYKPFIKNGKLSLAESNTLSTPEWLQKNFKNRDCSDIIYLNTVIKFDHWLPNHNFFKVIHIWDLGWSNTLGTIHPLEVNKWFYKMHKEYPNKRFILHYMQPHGPHITIGGQPTETKEQHVVGERHIPKKKRFIRDFISGHLSETQAWTIKKYLNIKSGIPLEAYYREFGKDGVIEVYKNEIKLGLEYVTKAMKESKGKWLITADHGVTVGEKGRFGLCYINTKEVREVPWLEVTV